MGAQRALIDSSGNEAKVTASGNRLQVRADFESTADLDTIEATLTAIEAALDSIGTDKLRVDIVSSITVPISASSLPLPAGAATEATLTTVKDKLDALDDALASIGTDQLRVDVISSALPSGASTSAKQDTMITALQKIDDLQKALASIATDKLRVSNVDTVTVSGTVTIQEPLSIDDNGGSITVDGAVTAQQATPQNLKALAYGFDGTNYQPLKVDSSGKLVVTI